MGRKKNIKNNQEKNDRELENESEGLKQNLVGDAKKDVIAIALFALAILIFLGFFGYAGAVGQFLNRTLALFIGWIKLIFPLFLIVAGVVLLFRQTVSFYVYKLLGLTIVFLSLAGVFHWFFNFNQMLSEAALGKGGGYTGYVLDYILKKYLGNAGSFVVLLAMFFIGIIVAFNFPIFNLFSKFKEIIKKRKEKAGTLENEEESKNEESENLNVSEENESEKTTEKETEINTKKKKEAYLNKGGSNIGRIEFAEGNDQYISPELGNFENDNYTSEENHSDEPTELAKRKTSGLKNFSHILSVKSSKNQGWVFPPYSLLKKSSRKAKPGNIESNFTTIEKTLRDFGIKVTRGGTQVGPTVTQYRIRPAVGVKIASILSLQNDLALALAKTIRIEAPIPGESMVGIEVPNEARSEVRLRDILEELNFQERESKLMFALGKSVGGKYEFDDLAKLPHLLIAGATGKGKSVCLNSIITTFLYQNSPRDLKFIMIDPKRVELSLYNGIPHLLTDAVVENSKVVNALNWAVGEMERRYRLLQDTGSKDIVSYREKMKKGKMIDHIDSETNEVVKEKLKNMPYIIIVVDELSELMSSRGKEAEGAIVRIAQMARAVGIHLILSTQRPSVEVITGLIKANITTRIAFQVATQIDSRTILGMGGAEKLLGDGDMLYLSTNYSKPRRIQSPFISESEVKKVVKFIKEKNQSKEEEEKEEENIDKNVLEKETYSVRMSVDEKDKELIELAKEEIRRDKKASASFLQRRLSVGYSRAARILDILEKDGLVGPSVGNKPREIYFIDDED
ncbi:MAG TPA: DNA translocase FtsK, partial [Candidatus Moranbacteria bacterium]|nr:DNA translocase FtsK [Candidatus Moranbacteria bacterium]